MIAGGSSRARVVRMGAFWGSQAVAMIELASISDCHQVVSMFAELLWLTSSLLTKEE